MKHQCYRSHDYENKNILFKARAFACYNVSNNKSLNNKILAGLNRPVRTYLDNKKRRRIFPALSISVVRTMHAMVT